VIGKVCLERRGTPAGGRNLADQAIGLNARAPRLHGDRIAALRQRERNGAADALRAAGDKGGRANP
jgi:hypothetical protein